MSPHNICLCKSVKHINRIPRGLLKTETPLSRGLYPQSNLLLNPARGSSWKSAGPYTKFLINFRACGAKTRYGDTFPVTKTLMGAISLAFLQSTWPNTGGLFLKLFLYLASTPHWTPGFPCRASHSTCIPGRPPKWLPPCDTRWAALIKSSTSAKQLLVQVNVKTSSSNQQDSNSHGRYCNQSHDGLTPPISIPTTAKPEPLNQLTWRKPNLQCAWGSHGPETTGGNMQPTYGTLLVLMKTSDCDTGPHRVPLT